MTERKNAKAMAGGSLHDRMQAGLDLPLQGRLHTLHKATPCLSVCVRGSKCDNCLASIDARGVIISVALKMRPNWPFGRLNVSENSWLFIVMSFLVNENL